ncbi:MAG: bifunctional phosphoribosylaminoimidazolecarboxamide formyltransferase/IMP cyclohydrolase [Saprospiraceae bacterium]|nr:bifunctional phosphoribosylaminoimidazolecarboxamide formyltransferase/IMP cyclohydrolase [Saprospiraceae bacterium]
MKRPIRTALISVFHKDGLEPIIRQLEAHNVKIYSTGGTQKFIESLGVDVHAVEDLTSYPSILDGRVKTLHPKVFGGILARREDDHMKQLEAYDIPPIDLVIVDLYPFKETVAQTDSETEIIEKIDIGGISLIRAAAKNFRDVMIVSDKSQYEYLQELLNRGPSSELVERKQLAAHAFYVSADYDQAIMGYFSDQPEGLNVIQKKAHPLRYGENPHQKAHFLGDLDLFEQISGKALSYNNLVDVEAALQLMKEFENDGPTFAVLKHTNPCGIATRSTVLESWKAALAGDPISAFGGILISNSRIDKETAEQIHNMFYEVLIAPAFDDDAVKLLTSKKKRILLLLKDYPQERWQYKSILDGTIIQEGDYQIEQRDQFECMTTLSPSESQLDDLEFALKCVKHLKSNTIVLAKGQQLIGMGCGQTSRVDAAKQAIEKAEKMDFNLSGSVMASDAFFPFPDCVELGAEAGVKAIVQPGGSINDKASVETCDELGLVMVKTGVRHFKH